MNKKEMEQAIIQNYQKEENMMILVFAQWCINHDLDPFSLYMKAYPDQANNPALAHALELTVSKEEAGDISNDTVLGVLAMFGNDDLAFVVSEEMEKLKKDRY
ncbi:hypothetical protein [Sutcliffiella horikoshii]|uniref:hypothetical protein n=1 Tax=Sutcliffiella horikoshii TaxID=79883 RepID=UPI001F45F06F|nr:hypothetical protein [Sutcliffiella horikoshii]MCG1022941.1 hypothetical protein [Sutcliffiella horikoshii]